MASRPAPPSRSKQPAAACRSASWRCTNRPCIVDDTHAPLPADFLARLKAAVAENRRSDAVKMFLRLVDLPAIALLMMPLLPAWSKLKAVAHTLPYDITIVQENQRGTPFAAGRWAGAAVLTLAMDGGKSPAWIRNGMRALAGAAAQRDVPDPRGPDAHGQGSRARPRLDGVLRLVGASVQVAPALRGPFEDGLIGRRDGCRHSPRD